VHVCILCTSAPAWLCLTSHAAPDTPATTLMQVRVFGLEEQSRMRGLDPKVRTVCACNVKYHVGTGCYVRLKVPARCTWLLICVVLRGVEQSCQPSAVAS
jgi:hypothetical protein